MAKSSVREQILVASEGEVPWMLDLSLWFAWHSKRGTLPPQWTDSSYVEIAHELGSPAWVPVKPWKAVFKGVDVAIDEGQQERTVRYNLAGRTLSASWTLGPDNDWWQMDHIIASPEDFEPALELAESLHYEIDESLLLDDSHAGERILLAIELPRRPLSALLHDYLGWGEGLLMLQDYEREVDQLLQILDAKIQSLVDVLAEMPSSTMFSPDNLDGQYISPDLFARHLTPSYSLSCQRAHSARKSFVVHVGGPMEHLLGPLAAAGVDMVEGVCGPPQSDAPLPEARRKSGPELTLWGGIPQDWLLETTALDEFRAGVEQVVDTVADDGNSIIGVADRVPVAAEIERLGMLKSLIK